MANYLSKFTGEQIDRSVEIIKRLNVDEDEVLNFYIGESSSNILKSSKKSNDLDTQNGGDK